MADEQFPFPGLPGFLPDAVPYATRTALALLLAYWVCFAAQIPTASTAGICVALVAQPSAGMAFSKALYRQIGTIIGGAVAIGLLAAFPQDRTMLLAGFALWTGTCAFVATLLRDFRSYGAALSGYTVGIIAIAAIDAPESGLINTLNRVAAITVGILSVMVVNSLLRSNRAFDDLVKALRQGLDQMTDLVVDALGGRLRQEDMALVKIAAGAAALQSQAVYAATELPDGRARANGARFAIAALLAQVSAARSVGRTLAPDTRQPVLAHLAAVAAALRDGGRPPEPPHPATPAEAVLLERADELLARHRDAEAGLRMLVQGDGSLPHVRLGRGYDLAAAGIGAARTVAGVALGSLFCVLAGWPGVTLLLIQQAAFTTLLGTQPDPTKASLNFLPLLLPMALVVAGVNFFALPLTSGFGPFALVVGSAAFATALLSRHARLAAYGPTALLYLTLLLGPSNTATFDVASFCNTVLQVALSVAFTVLSFNLILPVSPSRRLYRVAASIARDLRRTLGDPGRLLDQAPDQSRFYDRMAHALTWLGRPTLARQRLLSDIYSVGEVDLAVRRARSGLKLAAEGEPGLAGAVQEARRALASGQPAPMLAAAQALLDHPASRLVEAPVRQAASGMAGLARLVSPGNAARRFLRKLPA